jgi:hypothetical protein
MTGHIYYGWLCNVFTLTHATTFMDFIAWAVGNWEC